MEGRNLAMIKPRETVILISPLAAYIAFVASGDILLLSRSLKVSKSSTYLYTLSSPNYESCSTYHQVKGPSTKRPKTTMSSAQRRLSRGPLFPQASPTPVELLFDDSISPNLSDFPTFLCAVLPTNLHSSATSTTGGSFAIFTSLGNGEGFVN